MGGQTDQNPPIHLTQEAQEALKERKRRPEQPKWNWICIGFSRWSRAHSFGNLKQAQSKAMEWFSGACELLRLLRLLRCMAV
jgi:hypothetical protein